LAERVVSLCVQTEFQPEWATRLLELAMRLLEWPTRPAAEEFEPI
jgi:hypothetical protein